MVHIGYVEEKIVYDIEDNYSIICADELYPYE